MKCFKSEFNKMFCFQSATQPQQTALIDCLDNLRPGYWTALQALCVFVLVLVLVCDGGGLG